MNTKIQHTTLWVMLFAGLFLSACAGLMNQEPLGRTGDREERGAFHQHTGTLIVLSVPPGADLQVIDRSETWLAPWGPGPTWRPLGVTPYKNAEMPAGSYWIRATHGGKTDIVEALVPEGGEVRKTIMFPLMGTGGRGDYGGP